MWFDLALIAAGGFLAALVVGSAGFAFAIIVTGVWIYVLPPAQIVFLAAVCATLLHIASIWRFRREIEFGLLWPFVIGGALGVPLGRAGPAEAGWFVVSSCVRCVHDRL